MWAEASWHNAIMFHMNSKTFIYDPRATTCSSSEMGQVPYARLLDNNLPIRRLNYKTFSFATAGVFTIIARILCHRRLLNGSSVVFACH